MLVRYCDQIKHIHVQGLYNLPDSFIHENNPPSTAMNKEFLFKNRRTVARVRRVKNLKTFTGYIQLKDFKLSAVRLQPSMDKNGKNDNYNKYKNR